jgi:hypothetical protein
MQAEIGWQLVDDTGGALSDCSRSAMLQPLIDLRAGKSR